MRGSGERARKFCWKFGGLLRAPRGDSPLHTPDLILPLPRRVRGPPQRPPEAPGTLRTPAPAHLEPGSGVLRTCEPPAWAEWARGWPRRRRPPSLLLPPGGRGRRGDGGAGAAGPVGTPARRAAALGGQQPSRGARGARAPPRADQTGTEASPPRRGQGVCVVGGEWRAGAGRRWGLGFPRLRFPGAPALVLAGPGLHGSARPCGSMGVVTSPGLSFPFGGAVALTMQLVVGHLVRPPQSLRHVW